MMKKIVLFLVLTIPFYVFSQNLSLEINTRSSKIDTVFDWYLGLGLSDSIKNSIRYELFSSIERDQGILYHSYKGNIQHKHFKISHITDTEKDIIISSLNIYRPIKIKDAIIKLGFDVSYSDVLMSGGFVGFQYKYISVETSFFDTFYKLTYKIEPKLKLNKNISISLFIVGVLVEEKYKWRNGLKFNLKL